MKKRLWPIVALSPFLLIFSMFACEWIEPSKPPYRTIEEEHRARVEKEMQEEREYRDMCARDPANIRCPAR